MDSASENEELGASFLSDNSGGHQYLLADEGDDSRDGDDDDDGDRTGVLREQDRFLPIANVARLMKKAIPKSGKIAKDARECVQECVSEFVSFITSEASDRCHQEKRKTINGEDILFAMQTLGFDNYVEPLKIYLQKYRESIKGEKTGAGEGLDASSITLGDGSFLVLDDKVEMLNTGLDSAQGTSSTADVKVSPGLSISATASGDPVIFYSSAAESEFTSSIE